MNKNRLIPRFAAAAALTLFLPACSPEPEQPTVAALPPVSVRVQTVTAQPYQAIEEIVGTVRSKLRSTIEAKVSGRIEEMRVASGQLVKTGDLLARLSVQEIKARLDQALATFHQADRDLKRFSDLLDQQAVTQAEFDAIQARQGVAQAAVSEAETMLGYATITAPFDGVISRKLADVGDLATPGRPLIEIEDPGSLRLEADVPEALADRLHLGLLLPVHIAARTNLFDARVSEIAPTADSNSRTFLVKLDLPPAVGLRAGLFGRVAVPVGERTILRVPASAVVRRGQMEMVFVVADERARMRLVKTGKRLGPDVEVVSGIEAGERIVTEGAARLTDGQAVEIKS